MNINKLLPNTELVQSQILIRYSNVIQPLLSKTIFITITTPSHSIHSITDNNKERESLQGLPHLHAPGLICISHQFHT